jgi:hypothetical protein
MTSRDQTILENIYVSHILQEAIVNNDIPLNKPFFVKNMDWFMRVTNDHFLRIGSKQLLTRIDFLKKFSGKTITNHGMTKNDFERVKR